MNDNDSTHRSNLARAVRATPKAGPRRRAKPLTPTERIDALRWIVAECQAARVEGALMDAFTASAIVQVYDRLNPDNQAKLAALPVRQMAATVWRMLK